MTRMSLVHGGGDVWGAVVVREAGVLVLGAADVVVGPSVGLGPVEVDVAGEVLGIVDVLGVPDPVVALVHPARAAPATSVQSLS